MFVRVPKEIMLDVGGVESVLTTLLFLPLLYLMMRWNYYRNPSTFKVFGLLNVTPSL